MDCGCCLACDERGNCRGVGNLGVVAWTLMGALAECYPGKEFLGAYNKVRDKLGSSNITGWNNTPGRTYLEVITLLRELDI